MPKRTARDTTPRSEDSAKRAKTETEAATPTRNAQSRSTALPSDAGIPRASLLGLPPELRNQIYELVLIRYHAIDVDADPTEPGLLYTCKQLREEAREIFLFQNWFTVTIYDFDLKPQPAHWCWIREPDMILDLWWAGTLNWDNFLEYAKSFHAGRAPEPDEVSVVLDRSCKRLYLQAFKIVKSGRKKDQAWEEVLEELEGLADVHLWKDLY